MVVVNMIYLGDWDNIKRNYIFKGVLCIVHFVLICLFFSFVNKCN